MTKKKQPANLEKLPTTIPCNAKGRKDSGDKGLITGFMQNHKRGAPLKITPTTNKKIKTKFKVTLDANPTKQDRPATRDNDEGHPGWALRNTGNNLGSCECVLRIPKAFATVGKCGR